MPSRFASSVDWGYISRPARIWNKSLPEFSFHLFVVLLGRGRRGQRKNVGVDASRCRGAQDGPHFFLSVLSAAFWFCSLLLLHAAAASAAAVGRSCCCTTVPLLQVVLLLMFANPKFKPFSFPIVRRAEGL